MTTMKLTQNSLKKILSLAEKILRSGGILICPTDTVYGILGDATNRDAIKKIFALKTRSAEKKFPIFVKDIPTARKFAYIADAKAKFLEKVWLAPLETARPEGPSGAQARARSLTGPGPLTVVLHHKEKLPKILTPHQSKLGAGQAGGLGTIGIRIPNHPFLLELLSRLDFPLVQTSANISGKPPAKNIKEIKEYFGKERLKPELIIDGGQIDGTQSTVIDFTGNEPILLRTGAISKLELDRLLSGLD